MLLSLDSRCSNCGETLRRAMLSALISDAGAEISWDPCKCPDGNEHDFREPEPEEAPDA